MNNLTRFRQADYRDWQLRDAQFLDILVGQQRQLRHLARGPKIDEAEMIEALKALDLELLQYACQRLASDLVEVAREDCALLIAGSVLEASQSEEVIERWNTWLSTTAWWPQLAQEHWRWALNKAVGMLIEQLESDGILVDRVTAEAIESAMKELELSDLLPPAMYANHFPIMATELSEADY